MQSFHQALSRFTQISLRVGSIQKLTSGSDDRNPADSILWCRETGKSCPRPTRLLLDRAGDGDRTCICTCWRIRRKDRDPAFRCRGTWRTSSTRAREESLRCGESNALSGSRDERSVIKLINAIPADLRDRTTDIYNYSGTRL